MGKKIVGNSHQTLGMHLTSLWSLNPSGDRIGLLVGQMRLSSHRLLCPCRLGRILPGACNETCRILNIDRQKCADLIKNDI